MDSKLTAAEFQCVSEPCQDRVQEAATRCKGGADKDKAMQEQRDPNTADEMLDSL